MMYQNDNFDSFISNRNDSLSKILGELVVGLRWSHLILFGITNFGRSVCCTIYDALVHAVKVGRACVLR
jgi:hypothetical protein